MKDVYSKTTTKPKVFIAPLSPLKYRVFIDFQAKISTFPSNIWCCLLSLLLLFYWKIRGQDTKAGVLGWVILNDSIFCCSPAAPSLFFAKTWWGPVTIKVKPTEVISIHGFFPLHKSRKCREFFILNCVLELLRQQCQKNATHTSGAPSKLWNINCNPSLWEEALVDFEPYSDPYMNIQKYDSNSAQHCCMDSRVYHICYNNKRDGRCSDVNAKSKQRFNQIYIRYFVIYVNKIYKIQINSTTTLYP